MKKIGFCWEELGTFAFVVLILSVIAAFWGMFLSSIMSWIEGEGNIGGVILSLFLAGIFSCFVPSLWGILKEYCFYSYEEV